jgi:acetylglutamate kinase
MQQLTIIKIGGNIIDDAQQLSRFLTDSTRIDGAKIIIHGGGKLATSMSATLGIPTQMIDGRRITDAETLKIVTMVYAGWINKSITAELNSLGVLAVGICGADGESIPAMKRPVGDIDYGFVGDILPDSVNLPFFQLLINGGFTPVVAPITADGKQLLNTNADTIAASIAISLSKYYQTQLLYCFEKNGVLTDIDNPQSALPYLDEHTFLSLKQSGAIAKGMIPKLENAFAAMRGGVQAASIGHANSLIDILNNLSGTHIVINS